MGADNAPAIGRPSSYSDEAAEQVCRVIASGGTLEQAGKAVGVSDETILRWLRDRPDFRGEYARARAQQGHWYADKISEITLDPKREPADIAARVNALKWLAAKRTPKVYGDRTHHEHTGANGGPIRTQELSHYSDEKLAALAALLGADADAGAGEGGDREAEGTGDV